MKTLCCILLWLISPYLLADDLFSVHLPECEARLERRAIEEEVALVRSDCPLSLKSLAQLLDAGLQGLFPDNNLSIRSIQLGRLMSYPEWSQALAKSAAQSPTWNARQGRPSQADESNNHRVRLLLNGPAYPQELKPIFAHYGFNACIADVEKVLVSKTQDIFPNRSAMQSMVSRHALLPVDAQIWLTLQPMATACVYH
jgi:hypothetical protein